MTNYIVRAQKFVRDIYPFIAGEYKDMDKVAYSIAEFNQMNHRNVKLDHGLTRIALITSDYVVKFDYDENRVAQFGGGEAEIELYKQAEADGYAYLFAQITRYEYMGRCFYIMPRIDGIGKYEYQDAWEFMTDAEYDWCCEHGLFDLHEKNYGWRDGRVCIIDYGAHN